MKITNKVKWWFYSHFTEPLNEVKFLQAKVLIENTRRKGRLFDIQDAEFKVFSQFGDDGII
jgi:hypothetical protein